MPELFTNIPLIRCFARPEFIGASRLTECDLIAAKSEPGSPLQFHALLRTGATYFNLPIHAFALTEQARDVRFDDEPTQQQLWDCQTYYFACLVINRLCDQKCVVRRLDGEQVSGRYLMTFDWRSPPNEIDTSVVNLPDERKSAHLIAGDDGLLYAMPNNRLRWEEPGFITPSNEPAFYTPIKRTWRCERSFITHNENRVEYSAAPTAVPSKPIMERDDVQVFIVPEPSDHDEKPVIIHNSGDFLPHSVDDHGSVTASSAPYGIIHARDINKITSKLAREMLEHHGKFWVASGSALLGTSGPTDYMLMIESPDVIYVRLMYDIPF